jgi:hypothetical protein
MLAVQKRHDKRTRDNFDDVKAKGDWRRLEIALLHKISGQASDLPGYISKRVINETDMPEDTRERLLGLYRLYDAKSRNKASLDQDDRDLVEKLLASARAIESPPAPDTSAGALDGPALHLQW